MVLPSREEFPLSREGLGQADGKEDCADSQPREQVWVKTAQVLGVEAGRQLRCEEPDKPSRHDGQHGPSQMVQQAAPRERPPADSRHACFELGLQLALALGPLRF